MERKPRFRRFIYLGMVFISLGIIYTTTLSETSGSLGMVFIALGGLFFIIGMAKKRKADEAGKEDPQDMQNKP